MTRQSVSTTDFTRAVAIAIAMTVAIFCFLTSTATATAIPETGLFTIKQYSSIARALEVDVNVSALQNKALGQEVALILPLSPIRTVELQLEAFPVFTPGARVFVATEAGSTPRPVPQVSFFRGGVAGHLHSHAYLSVSDAGLVSGYVSIPGEPTYFIATTPTVQKSGSRAVVISEEDPAADILDLENICGLDDVVQPFKGNPDKTPTDALGQRRVARIAFDCDSSYVALFGDQIAAETYAAQLIGAISDIYLRDVNTALMLDFLRSWPDGGEPFEADNLSGFANYWQINEDLTGLSIVHMLSGRRDLSYGGVGYVGGTCGGGTFSIGGYLNGSFPNPVGAPSIANWDIIVVAHEMGHNFGTYHTHDGFDPTIDDCGNGVASRGTIMSYCHTHPGYTSNIDLRFHRLVQEVMEQDVIDGDCMFYDCNGNGIPDSADIADLISDDVNTNGIPDECEDCNNNGILDDIEIGFLEPDVNGNGIIDYCEDNCNSSIWPDNYEIDEGIVDDLDGNNVPDECDPDCNGNGVADHVEIDADLSIDLDRNTIPDECDDCDGNGIPDWEDMERQHHLFVADRFNTVREYHGVSGVPIRNLGTANQPYDIVFGPDNAAYVADFGNDAVLRIDPDAGTETTFVSSGLGGLDGPSALAFDSTGNLLVASRNTSSILKFDGTTGAYLKEFVPSGSGGLNQPYGMVFGPDGQLYVSSSNDAVMEFDGDEGDLIGTFVSVGSGGLSSPRGLVFTPDGQLLVCSFGTDQVLEYDGSTGSYVGVFSDQVAPTAAWGIRIGPNGNVFVSRSSGTIRIIEYAYPQRRYYRSFVRNDDFLQSPTGFAFRPGSAFDCNANGQLDLCDISQGLAEDINDNGIIDDCETGSCCLGTTGNVDNDSGDLVNIVDLTSLVAYLFDSGDAPECLEEANVDAGSDGNINIVDLTLLVEYLFGDPPATLPDCAF